MLRKLAEYCTEALIRRDTIQKDKKAIYVYGFELFWSTFLCIVSILFFGIAFGHWKQSIVFLLFFLPIRTFTGGYHASSYGTCFLLTNMIALACVTLAGLLKECSMAEVGCWLMGGVAFIYIWRHAPVVFEIHPMKPERICKNRTYAHGLIVIEAVTLVSFIVMKYDVIYIALVSTCVVAFMMFIVRKKGG